MSALLLRCQWRRSLPGCLNSLAPGVQTTNCQFSSCHFYGSAAPSTDPVSIDKIKALRAATGASISSVREALIKSNGDMDSAIKVLQNIGQAKAAGKADRKTSQGLVSIYNGTASDAGASSESEQLVVITDLRCETDFVARTEQFVGVAKRLNERAKLIIQSEMGASPRSDGTIQTFCYSVDEFLARDDKYCEDRPSETLLRKALAQSISLLGENQQLHRVGYILIPRSHGGVVEQYIHGKLNESMGRVGVLIALDNLCSSMTSSSRDESLVRYVGRNLAMHIVGTPPQYVSYKDIPEALREEYRSQVERRAQQAGHTLNSKQLDQQVKGWERDICLMDQEYAGPALRVPDELGPAAAGSSGSGEPFALPSVVRVGDVLRWLYHHISIRYQLKEDGKPVYPRVASFVRFGVQDP